MTPHSASSRTPPSAFRAAIDAGYGIECDVQISADGEAMVHHDFILGRLTRGNSRLDERTAAELKGIEYFATADRMPTLGELCDLVAGRVPMLVEIKSRFDGDARLALPHRRGACRLSRPGRGDVVRSGDDRRRSRSHAEAAKGPRRHAT